MLSLIVAAWPQPLSRDRAMALLWPERDLGKARRLLNLAVHVLRSALGDDSIVSTGDGLLLNPSKLTCDLHELRDAVAVDDAERIVRCYTGALLDGFHLGESAEFGFWLDERRNELDHAYTGALRMVAESQERGGDVHGRVRTLPASRRDPPPLGGIRPVTDARAGRGGRPGGRHPSCGRAREPPAGGPRPRPDPEVVALAEQLRTAAPARGARRAATARSDQAYHLYLQGRRWLSDYTLTGIARAVDCFEHALAHDPTFALASACLAWPSSSWPSRAGASRTPHTVARQRPRRTRSSWTPTWARRMPRSGYLKAVRDYDWAGAEREFKRALELNPDDANAYDLYGRLCAATRPFR